MKKILFLTGTRADYGKIKSLMMKVNASPDFQLYIFVTGMHLLSRYGSTWREIEKDGFQNVYHFNNQVKNTPMDIALSNTIAGLSTYVQEIKPDLIVVHGDRLEALAGAIVGAFNNILVAHIEGGEVSGTIDESIRHAITKFAHIHLVSNEESKNRIIQMGENEQSVFVIGSPDIDIMYSSNLPSIQEVKKRYDINFDEYGIVMYHPVTTEINSLQRNVEQLVEALIQSKKNYIVIYPNNDLGSDLIIEQYEKFKGNHHFLIYPSLRFEYFLILLKHADFIIGNSSAGIRESIVYGTPAIDIGNRQKGRYIVKDNESIQHVIEQQEMILQKISNVKKDSFMDSSLFGKGTSSEHFLQLLLNQEFWNISIQKQFLDR